jgi:hypothetical protein
MVQLYLNCNEDEAVFYFRKCSIFKHHKPINNTTASRKRISAIILRVTAAGNLDIGKPRMKIMNIRNSSDCCLAITRAVISHAIQEIPCKPFSLGRVSW